MGESLATTLTRLKLDLPALVVQALEAKGIVKLFDWQVDLLGVPGIVDGTRNLVYSAPTSGGKSLVAEALLLSRVTSHKKKAILALPYLSLVQEKQASLKKTLEGTDVTLDTQVVDFDEDGELGEANIYVCTYETANNIINKFVRNNKSQELGIVVVDEAHCMGLPKRGVVVETLLTKLRHLRATLLLDIQIVLMSATVPNSEQLAEWLDNAYFHETDLRPVELKRFVKEARQVRNLNDGLVMEIKRPNFPSPLYNDTNHMACLTLQSLMEGGSVLIFCHQKKDAELVASNISQAFERILRDPAHPEHQSLQEKVKTSLIAPVLESLYDDFHDICGQGQIALTACVRQGVAFHHAGLSPHTRGIIEAAFRKGMLKVLVATSTLCAGVNLPARRVLVSSPLASKKKEQNAPAEPTPLDPGQFIQMSGRAGRTGIDPTGEAYLICPAGAERAGRELVKKGPSPVSSKLVTPDFALNERFVLDAIVLGIGNNTDELVAYLKESFYYHAHPHLELDDLRDLVISAAQTLAEDGFIRKVGRQLEAKTLGKAVVFSCMRQDSALETYKELKTIKSGAEFTLSQTIAKAVPSYVEEEFGKIPWRKFFNEISSKLDDEQQLSSGINPAEAGRLALEDSGPRDPVKKGNALKMGVAMMLEYLLSFEGSYNDAAKRFEIQTGYLTNVVRCCSSYSSMGAKFAKKMKWKKLSTDLQRFSSQLRNMLGDYSRFRVLGRVPVLNFEKIVSLKEFGSLEVLSELDTSVLGSLIQQWAMDEETKEIWKEASGRTSRMASDLADVIIKESGRVYKEKLERSALFD